VQGFFRKKLDSLKSTLCSLPSRSQWKLFFRVLTKKEKIIFLSCFVCFLGSLIFLSVNFYLQRTKTIPAVGGIYIEGIVDQPRFINPVLASNDIDRGLVELIFTGLMKVEIDGKIVPDLAKGYEIKEGGTVYEITLREDVFWHDGQKITTDDVVFTIKTIQDPDFKSPEIANWIGIRVEKISEQKLIFKLKDPYFPFLERLTVKVLPKHIFGDILAESFPLTIYNLQPIGSGPFRFKEIKYDKLGKIESLTLARNENYFGKLPHLKEVKFLFFETEKEVIEAAQRKEIQGFTISNPEIIDYLEKEAPLYEISLPRYFAIFFNPKKSDISAEKEVRESLDLATNKSEILEKAIKSRGKIVSSPILPEFYGFDLPSGALAKEGPDVNLEKAKELLEEAGFVQKDGKFFKIERETTFNFEEYLKEESRGQEVKDLQECLSFFPDIYPEGEITGYFGKSTEKAVILFQEKYKEEILEPWEFEEGTGIVSKTTRKKLNEVCNEFSEESLPLKLFLVTVNQPFLVKTAKILKEQWEKLGIEIEIKALEFNELSRNFIKPREYEILLFGEALGIIPDPLAFWHSSRIEDPGLNLAMYENKKADEFLKEARMAQDFEQFKKNLEKFQNILIEDKPAIFLYSPNFLYYVSKEIKGIDFEIISEPSKRFIEIESWYLKTKRVWK